MSVALSFEPREIPDEEEPLPAAGIAIPLPARAETKWTPDDIECALSDADGGDLQRAADLVEMIMVDPQVTGVLNTRTHGMLRLGLSFEGGIPDARLALAGDTDGEIGDYATMHPEAELVQLLAWAFVLGVGFAQRVPLPREIGERQLHRLEAWHPRWFRQNVYSRQWSVLHRDGSTDIVAGEGQWIRFAPYGEDRPWARGAWRALAFAWIVKQFALHDRARFSEVFGTPMRVGKAPEGATERHRRRWIDALKALGKDTAIVLPPGYDLELLSVGGSEGGVLVFEQQIEWADRAIAVVLAGQIVTTEGTPGFSNGSIHETIKADIIGFSASATATMLHDQSLVPWARLGYGTAKAAPYPLWDTTLPEDQERKAAALRGIGDAIDKLDQVLAPSGVRVDAMRLAEQYGIPTIALPQTDARAPSIQLAPTDVAKVVRVDEARSGANLGPWGDDDGTLSVAEFAAKREAAREVPAVPAQVTP